MRLEQVSGSVEVLKDATAAPSSLEFAPSTDRVTFEVLRHRLWQINQESGRALVRVSGSIVASEANDFNVGIMTADGEVVAFGPYIFAHLPAISQLARATLAVSSADGMGEGDMYLTNDPYLGAPHQNDVGVMAPLHRAGELVAWMGSTLHHLDVGGPVPGGWSVSARDVFGEPPRWRFLRIVQGGRNDHAIIGTLLANSRTPNAMEIDLRAQIAAGNVARARMDALFDRYGVEAVISTMRDVLSYSEIGIRRKLAAIPDGEWLGEGHLDHDGHDDRIYTIRCRATKVGDSLTLDFTGSDGQAPGFINCTGHGLVQLALCPIATFLGHDLPWNGGLFRAVRIVAQRGTVCDAEFPAAVSMASISASYGAMNATADALAKMLGSSSPYRDTAMGTWNGSCLIWSHHGRDSGGRTYSTVAMDYKAGGGGAGNEHDGLDAAGNLTTPIPSIPDVEAIEAAYPVRYLWRRRTPDSGGPGRWRGGVSTDIGVTPNGAAAVSIVMAAYGSDHSPSVGTAAGFPGAGANFVFHSQALAEGRPDAPSAAVLPVRPEELTMPGVALPPKGRLELRPGDVFRALAPGGGGFGDPLERPPELVARDVARGCVSPAMARSCYGVVLRGDGQIDRRRTAARRRRAYAARRKAIGEHGPAEAMSWPRVDGSRLGEYLVRGETGWHCRRCGTPAIPLDEPAGAARLTMRRPLSDAGPWLALRWRGRSRQFELRHVVCPGCGGLLFTQQRRKEEPIEWDDHRWFEP